MSEDQTVGVVAVLKVGQKWKQKASLRAPERVIEVVEIQEEKIRIRHKQTLSLVAYSGFFNGKFTLEKDVS